MLFAFCLCYPTLKGTTQKKQFRYSACPAYGYPHCLCMLVQVFACAQVTEKFIWVIFVLKWRKTYTSHKGAKNFKRWNFTLLYTWKGFTVIVSPFKAIDRWMGMLLFSVRSLHSFTLFEPGYWGWIMIYRIKGQQLYTSLHFFAEKETEQFRKVSICADLCSWFCVHKFPK